MRTTPEVITKLEPDEIFVFGSNLAGRHGRGAAKQAVKFGAAYGQWDGLMGQSYGIPTKDHNLYILDLKFIAGMVARFLNHAMIHRELTYLVTPIGCGLAGYKPDQIGPMFKPMANVVYPACFLPFLSI